MIIYLNQFREVIYTNGLPALYLSLSLFSLKIKVSMDSDIHPKIEMLRKKYLKIIDLWLKQHTVEHKM